MADTTASSQGRPLNVRGGLLTALIFLPPALTLFTLFVILPIGEAAWYGFYNWNGLGAPRALRSALRTTGSCSATRSSAAPSSTTC